MKITGKKLLAVLCTVVMLVTTIVPSLAFTASATDTTTIMFTLGADGSASHADGTSKTSYSETVDSYTLNITGAAQFYTGARDAKGNSAIKLGSSKNTGNFTFTVPADVTSVIIHVAKYKANATKVTINGTTYTISGASNDGVYDAITVDTTTTKTVTLKTVSGAARAMVNTIEFVITPAASGCTHTNTVETITTPAGCTTTGSKTITCNDCDEYSITEEIPALNHDYSEYVTREEATCAKAGSKVATCNRCGEEDTQVIPALAHKYDNNKCTVCGADMPLEATITFDDKSKRTEYSSTIQIWEENGIILTNNKDKSTTNVGDFADPLRIYKSSQVVISAPTIIEKLVILGGDESKYITPIKDSLEAAGYTVTVDGKNYIIEPNSDTVTFSASAQIRFASITVTLHKHEWSDATCTAPQTCSKCGATQGETLDHTPGEVTIENKTDATFDNEGSYDEVVYCTVCKTELSRKTVKVPALKAVAKIDEQRYETLQAAIDAATAGQTITLLANITEGVTVNKAVVIDGAGFTVTGKVEVVGHAGVVETVEFNNVNFVTDAAEMNAICVNILNNAEVIFDGCDFTSTSSDRSYNGCRGIKISYNCTVEIKNCTASKLFYMVDAHQSINTTLTVDNCTLTDMVYGIGAYRCVNVVIKDFTYTGMSYSINVQNIATSLTLENVNVNQPINMDAHYENDTQNQQGLYEINLKGTNYYNGTEILPKNDNVWFERENPKDPYKINHIDHVEDIKIQNENAPTCTTPGSYDQVVYCTKCDDELSRKTITVNATGHSYDEGVVTAPTYEADGYTTYTCATCGNTYTDNHTDKLEKIVISKSCIVLKEAININFLISDSILVDGRDYVAVIKKGDTVVAEIPYSEWTSNGSYKVITYTGIVAKQMADLYTVVIYDGELQVSDERIDGVTEYVKRAIEAGVFTDPESAELATLLVDMLNYGAAAQIQWNYNTDNLANAIVADYQNFATQTEVTFGEDIATKASENYGSTTASLKDRVILNFNFKEGTLEGAAKAIISYTDHYGNEVSYEIAAEDFGTSKGRIIIAVDKLVAADARCIVTCTFVDAEGNAIDGIYAQDSIANYCARAIKYYGAETADANIYESIMKYSDAATTYFGK